MGLRSPTAPQTAEGGVRPDYALFASTEDYETAACSPNEPKTYYSRAQAIAEAKYWGRPLAKSFAEKRASFLQWVTHETGIIKVPTILESPWQLQQEEFLAVLKKAGLEHSSPATLQHLTRTFESESAALRSNRADALSLERELDELILKIYKLTPDEITLLRQTAPPRSLLNVLETDLKDK